MVMAVVVKSDTSIKTMAIETNMELAKTILPAMSAILVIDQTGCTKAPTPKSVIARLRIRTFEGVRKDGVLIKVMMIKKFKTVDKTPLKALKTIIETKK